MWASVVFSAIIMVWAHEDTEENTMNPYNTKLADDFDDTNPIGVEEDNALIVSFSL